MDKKAQISNPTTDFFNDYVLQNLDYLRYLIAHKNNIVQAGVKANLNPGNMILHDWSKFKPKSFDVYEDYFFGPEGIRGKKLSPVVYKNFRDEVYKHYTTEKHHNHKLGLPKNLETEIESVVDWYSTGKANADLQGRSFPNFIQWWEKNKYNLLNNNKISQEAFNKIEEAIKKDYNIFSYTVDKLKQMFKL